MLFLTAIVLNTDMSNKSERWLSILFSVCGYVVLPPAIIAIGMGMFRGGYFSTPAFFLALGVDLLVGFVVNQFVSVRRLAIMAEMQKEQMDYERGHVVGVSCANCGERNLVPLDLSIDAFECTKCKHTNKLFYEFRAQQVSDIDRRRMMEELASRIDMSHENDEIWKAVK